MSTKEIKAALKAAKTAIQAKDYETALEHCDLILKNAPENYNAFVFAGLCYSEMGKNTEAREKYRKAIKSQPDQILAYQGLSNLYTKHWKQTKTKDDVQELITVFEKLLSLTDRKEPKRRIELRVLLCNALMEVGDFVKALEDLSAETKEFQDQDREMKLPLFKTVFNILEKINPGRKMRQFSELVDDSFSFLVDSYSEDGKVAAAYVSQYLAYLRGNSELLSERISIILDVCAKLRRNCDATLPLEIMVQAYIQNYEHPSLNEIDEILTKLEESEYKFAHVGLGYIDIKSNKFEEAFTKLNSAMPSFPSFLPGWVILCKSAMNLHKYSDVKRLSRRGLSEYKLISSGSKPSWLLPVMSLDEVMFKLSKCLANGLCGSHRLEDITNGVGAFEKLLVMKPGDVDLNVGMAEGLIKLEKYTEASKSIQEALAKNPDCNNAEAWKGYIEFKNGNTTDGIKILESVSPPTSLSYFLLGKCLWEAGGDFRKDKKNCFAALVKAAKLDSYRGEVFFLLGNFYSKVQLDNARAKNCYLKAYQLDPQHQETAACLADAYVVEGDTRSAIEMYENITRELGSAGGKWAWLRLGLYKLKAKDITNAIQCFQSALRIDTDDSICWECLGEGYLQRGSFTAAWKAFDRAHQLNPRSVFSIYQMAKVKQVQGLFPEAITEYTDVLKLFPNYVPALQGLGESELLLTRQMFQEGRFQTGLKRLENAIRNLATACYERRDLCCLWKLLGDCCLTVHSLDESVVKIEIPSALLSKGIDEDIGSLTKIGKSELLFLGTRLYCRAVQLQSKNATLWHDLGISYFRRAENSKPDANEFTTKATNCIKEAITLEPANHVFWCSLGTIAASQLVHRPALAQHCFLTSIKNEKNNVQAWNNLATLYLAHDQVKKAHEAFKVAQSLEPSFAKSWVGQAIIAETVGSDETMDLYRHSTELGLQKQGAAGYASWVATVMSDLTNRDSTIFKNNITDLNAAPTATTLVSKMCSKDPSCAWMSTIHGFLLEQSGLNQSAEKAYGLAFDIMKAALTTDDSTDKELETRSKNCAVNLARTLCTNGKFEEAVDLYTRNTENLDVHDVCGLALALFKSQQYEKALEGYKKAGQLDATDDEKSQIMVAMAMTFWRMGKPDEAKTLLYQCFQNCKPGLQTLLSLGIALQDNTLVGAAVGEVIKKVATSDDKSGISDDCLLIATAVKLFGNSKVALNEVQKALHRNPSSWLLRVLLCRLLLDLEGFHGVLSTPLLSTEAELLFTQQSNSNPLHRDSELWKSSTRHKHNMEVEKCCAVSSVAAGCAKKKTNFCKEAKGRLRRAQKFAHMHPYDPSSWRLLICACHARDVLNWVNGEQQPNNGNLLPTLAKRVSKFVVGDGHEEQTGDWIQKICCWNSILNDSNFASDDIVNLDVKFISLLGAASRTKEKNKLQLILKDITQIMGSTTNPGRSSRYFAELLMQIKMYQVSRKMLDKSISLQTRGDIEKLSLHFRMFQLLYNVVVKDESKKELVTALKNSTAEIIKIDPKSTKSLLFQGMAARIENNHRRAKSFFNRVLNSNELISDATRSVAIWYLYRTLHERSDSTEIGKLVDKALELQDPHVAKIVELLPAT